MGQIKVTYNLSDIEGLCLIESTVHGDERGYFMETFSQKDMYEAGLYFSFVQDNQSMSKKGVLRGLHFQKKFPQTKLVRVIRGSVYDVAVDLRAGSSTYGKYHGEILTENNRKQYLIPRGFAHGFLVLSDTAEFCYNDPVIGIEWPEVNGMYRGSANASGYKMKDGSPLILSEKDQRWLGIKDTFKF